MPAPSSYAGSWLTPHIDAQAGYGGVSNYAMNALNTGWCCRFTAKDTRDIASVCLNWNTITSAGVISLRIETIDATTGKPSGSLYDANAVVNATLTTGWQVNTFATLPTTGLVAGTEYAIVLLTTTGGTTMQLKGHVSSAHAGGLPTVVLTAADGTTRSNFAEVSGSNPVCTIIYEDSQEETPTITGMSFTTQGTALDIYGTRAAGLKFVVPANETWVIDGVSGAGIARNGTPNDLRVRIFNSANSAVTGTTRTVDKDSLTNISVSKRFEICFFAPVTLTAGTYRVVFDDAAQTGTNVNNYTLGTLALRSSALCPPSFSSTSTTNINAGPIVWTDDQTVINGAGLLFGTDSASASGGLLFGGTNMDGL